MFLKICFCLGFALYYLFVLFLGWLVICVVTDIEFVFFLINKECEIV